MKIDVTSELKNFEGDNLWHRLSEGCPSCGAPQVKEPLTVRRAITVSLGNMAGRDLADGKLIEYFNLGKRILEAEGLVELTVQEAALIQRTVKDQYRMIVAAQIWDILEKGKTEDKEDDQA